MKKTKARNPKKVAVPAVYVWAAGQKFKASNRQDDLNLVNSIFRNSIGDSRKESYYGQGDREKNFNRVVENFLHQGVIPFEREDLDLYLATFIYGQREHFILRSDRSWVDAGFLRATEKEITYIDLTRKIIREDSAKVELLSNSDKRDLLHTLDGLASASMFYRPVAHDEHILKITGKDGAFSGIDRTMSCAISLWNGPHPDSNLANMGQLNRRLGAATLVNDDNSLFLKPASSQVRLELTAASLVGQWLLIESDGFKSFGALPDLTADSEQRKIAVDAIPMVKKFTLGVTPVVYVPSDVSRNFSKMYPWFIPMDSKNWLDAILL
jgi:hypothetical protein